MTRRGRSGNETQWTFPVMAGLVPAIPMPTSAVPHIIEITGTGPVMTSGEAATNDRTSAGPHAAWQRK